MPTQNSISNELRHDDIATLAIPRVELFRFAAPNLSAMEAPGSIGENTGPTTGQISPRL